MKKFVTSALAATLVAGSVMATPVMAAGTQNIPLLVYRTGPYAANGIAIFAGMIDYFKLINSRDGGVNGVKIKYSECETAYKTDRGVECYDRLKDQYGSIFSPVSTGITYAIIDKATHDKIPVFSMGYGRTSAADGRVFPYVFNFPSTYWSQATAVIRYIANDLGGMDKLKGKNFAFIYLDHPYGKEPIPFFDIMAKKFGFTYDKYPVPTKSMTEQKSIWLQIRRSKPSYAIMWGWGAMNPTAIKEAASIHFPMDHFIGNWWSGAEVDVQAAGMLAKGYKSAAMHGTGKSYPVYADMKKYVYDAKQADNLDSAGDVLYNRGLVNSAYVIEAMRTAMKKFGNKPLTGEQLRWGMENLDVTAARIKELGMTGLTPPVKVSCANHEGNNPGIFVQQWDGTKWNMLKGFVPAMSDIVRPIVEQEAAKYAKEKGITPRTCS